MYLCTWLFNSYILYIATHQVQKKNQMSIDIVYKLVGTYISQIGCRNKLNRALLMINAQYLEEDNFQSVSCILNFVWFDPWSLLLVNTSGALCESIKKKEYNNSLVNIVNWHMIHKCTETAIIDQQHVFFWHQNIFHLWVRRGWESFQHIYWHSLSSSKFIKIHSRHFKKLLP